MWFVVKSKCVAYSKVLIGTTGWTFGVVDLMIQRNRKKDEELKKKHKKKNFFLLFCFCFWFGLVCFLEKLADFIGWKKKEKEKRKREIFQQITWKMK